MDQKDSHSFGIITYSQLILTYRWGKFTWEKEWELVLRTIENFNSLFIYTLYVIWILIELINYL